MIFEDKHEIKYDCLHNGAVARVKEIAGRHGGTVKRVPLPKSMNYCQVTVTFRAHSWAAAIEKAKAYKVDMSVMETVK